MTRATAGAVLLLVALVVTGLTGACGDDGDGPGGGSGGSGGGSGPDGDGPAATEGLAGSPAAARFLADYVTPEGRVVRHDEGGDTVSEGQAYALLIAAGTGDEDRFEQVWAWTRDHLQRDDGLFAWRWDGGAVADDQPAADADLDVVVALATAADRFERPEWRTEARRIADAVMEHETFEVDGRRLLAAGPWAVDPRTVNPSYLARCDYGQLAELTGDDGWERLGDDALDVVAGLADDGLPPDWAQVTDGGEVVPVADADGTEGTGRYGLDAARIPVRLAPCDEGRDIAAALWDRLGDGEGADASEHPLGLVGAAAAALAAGDDDEARRFLADAQDLAEASPTYYGTAWVAFGEALLADDTGLAAAPFRAELASAVQEPTTTAPTTTPSTTAPATTSPPTTSPAPTTPTTSPTTSTTDASTSATTATTDPSTGTGSGGATDPSAPPTPAAADDPAAGRTGDLSADEPGRLQQLPGRGSPDEPAPAARARRTTGALALTALAISTTLGAILGLRERHRLRTTGAAAP